MSLHAEQLDRAFGAVLVSAAGDALGSQYEFGPSLADGVTVTFGVGYFGHAVGEWTDDTSMAMPVLLALSRGESLAAPAVLGAIVDAWIAWAETSRDVGAQTRNVLTRLTPPVTETAARAVAEAAHDRAGRSGGNGSLMRTGPLALGFLAPGQEAALAETAGRLAQLTHWEDDNVDACVLWCLAIRHAILTGELDVHAQLAWVPDARRDRWATLIAEALAPGAHPRDFAAQNGWVVRAFQAALCAVASTPDAVSAVEAAVRGGADTDTVAAIAGALAGAIHGADAVPSAWHDTVHGWPGLRTSDLRDLVIRATA